MSSHEDSLLARLVGVALSPAVIDLLIALGLTAAATTLRVGTGWERTATILLVAFPLAFRSRFPLPVLVATAAGTVITQAVGGWIDVVAVGLAAFSTGDLSRNRFTSAISVLAVAAAMAGGFASQTPDPALALTLPFVVIVPSWVVGVALRTRRTDAEERAEAVARRASEQAAAAQTAIAEERRHIARELHDVVAHGVSVMLIQTGAARTVLRTAPDEAEQSLLAAESAGRDAMAELRRLLGVLADEGEAATRSPQSGVAQLESLVARVCEAGLPADLRVEGEPRSLAGGVEVAIYRIAQEALTNALRHTGRAPTHVRLAYGPTEVELEVVDEGPGVTAAADGATPEGTDGAGRGLVGMRQRVALFGGRLEAGPLLGRGYAVRAWLPTPTGNAGAAGSAGST